MDHLLLDSNADHFDQAINRLIADGKDRELLDRLTELSSVVERLRADPEDRFDVSIPIVNACAAAATGLRRGKPGVAEAALDALLAAYRLGTVDSDGGPEDDLLLWETAAGGLWALGAVAARQQQWQTIRSIVARAPVDGGHYRTWLRHAQVMSARGASDPFDDNVLNLCFQRLRANPSFDMTDASEEDHARAICSFDQLSLLIVADLFKTERMSFYPSYAKYPVAYVEPLIIELREAGPMRAAVFTGDNNELREVLRDANEMALYQAAQHRYRHPGGWRYEGFQDARTWAFIRENHMFESWANLTVG